MQGRRNPRVIWRRTRHRAAMAIRARGHAVPTDPVFVIAAARTGSTMFVDLLRSLPGVSFRGEVLNPDVRIGLRQRWISRGAARRHLRHSIATQPGSVRGAKVLLNQLNKRRMGAGDFAAEFPHVRFLLLYRRSLADQLVSGALARQAGQWQDRRGDRAMDHREVHIEPEGALDHMVMVRRLYQEFLASDVARGRTLLVCYEELSADPARVIAEQVCPFLGLEPAPVTTTLQKQVRRPIAELVRNWDEVAPILTGPDAQLEL